MSETKPLAAASDLIAALKGKRRFDTMSLPICGLTVRFQSLSALERGRHQAATLTKDGNTDPTRIADADARLIVACLVDADGNRLFTDKESGGVCQWEGADASSLAKRLRKHCGLTTEEERPADFTESESNATPPAVLPIA